MKNTVKKTVQAGRNGGTIKIGNPGNKGGGRTPDAWKALCRELASSQEFLHALVEVIADKKHPAWLGAGKFVAENAYGRPEQRVTLEAMAKLLIVR